jgi:putative DNA methylase
MMIKAPKKLIEVALPLDDINAAAAREKSIRHGHPSTLHLWWARRPLAAARAVLFAQLVNDPGGERGWGKYPGQTKEDAQKERERLFAIIRELVKWENTNNEELLEIAREEIRKSWRETCELNKGKPGFDPDKLPAFHDPFAGGGAIPLEAQRLGMEAYASDLNPVAVMINKAMIEIPPKFAGKAPVGPIPEGEQADTMGGGGWTGAKGLAEDVRRYGLWILNEAKKTIGNQYPPIKITETMAQEHDGLNEHVGFELPVIAWIWARTIKSPNPAYSNLDTPLMTTFILSGKKGKEVWLDPIVDTTTPHFKIKQGTPPQSAKSGTKISRGRFRCIYSGTPIEYAHINDEAEKGRMGAVLICAVLENRGRRLYVPCSELPNEEQKNDAIKLDAKSFGTGGSNAIGRRYGFNTIGDYFTDRQRLALSTFLNLIHKCKANIESEAIEAGFLDDKVKLHDGGVGALAYSEAVSVYLAFALDKCADLWSSLVAWTPQRETLRNTFARQLYPMTWDFAEANPFSTSTGSWNQALIWITKSLLHLPRKVIPGKALQQDSRGQLISTEKIVSTDPPYYDNVGYADLSDFFYPWMRQALLNVYPDVFLTKATPKKEELVALYYRHDSQNSADIYFMDGMVESFKAVVKNGNLFYPITIYYAFKQSDTRETETYSSGWESFLDALLKSGLAICGTWPVRSERGGRLVDIGRNSLASSIVLVCRVKSLNSQTTSRRDFLRILKEELPEALEAMIGGKKGASPIAPVDLAQAAIGPGMAVFSRYSGIIEADGSKMSVHDALIQINKVIDEFFNEAEGDMDSDTRFCIDWFMQYGFKQAEYGQADVLARAKGTTVEGLAVAGVVETGGGKVRLLKFEEYPENWDPERDTRTPTWEALHQLIRALRSGGEEKAGLLLKKMAERTESIRQLAYRLYTLCERKGWAEEARAYNELIASWHGTIEAVDQAGGNSRREKHLTFDM